MQTRATVALTVIITALVLTPLHANGQPSQTICTNATLKGSYGISISGIKPSGPGAPLEQMVGTVIRHFDGAGGFTQSDNVHGAISTFVADRPGQGTYSVKADCTGVVKLKNEGAPVEIEERIVVVDGGDGFFGATAQPVPVLVTSHGRKISSRTMRLDELTELLQQIAVRVGVGFRSAR